MIHVGSLIVMMCVVCSLTACSALSISSPTSDSPKFLRIADTEFRKAGAFKVDMLRMGFKKSGKFEPLFMPELPQTIPVHLSTETFTEQSRTAAVDAGLNAGNTIASGGLSSEISKQDTSKGIYKVFIVRDVIDLVEALNSEPNRERLEKLRMYDEPRIVVGVAVAFGQESSEKLSTQALANLSLTKYSAAPEIRLGGSLANSVTVKLSDGTTFAYDLARMCFTETAGRVVVARLDPDRPARDDNCPSGTYKSIIALDEAKAASLARGGTR